MRGRIFLLFILFVAGQVRAEETLQNPIAFSQDGIIYLADDDVSYALSWDGSEALNCYSPRWSEDGQTLVFLCSDNGIAFYVAPSGEVPRLLLHDSPELNFVSEQFAVAPDGSAVAFFAWSQEERGIFTVSVETGEIRFIATAFNSAIGEGGNFYDPAEIDILMATGSSFYQDQFAIAWGEYGILHTPANDVGLLALSSPEGGEIWGNSDYWGFIFDAEGKYAAGISFDEEWVLIDVATGEYSPMNLPENAKPLGWVGDEFFYRTRTDIISVIGNPTMQSGIDLFDYNWGFFTATTANLNIFLDMPDGEDELVATLQGYDIGFIEGLAINELFVYFVNSNVPLVVALNEGADADAVQPLASSPEMLLLQVAYKDDQANTVKRFPFTSFDTVQSSGQYVIGNE